MKRIETLHLYPELSSDLIELLQKIPIKDWDKPSPIKGRTVKDLVSHLIDSSLRRLSMQRDKYSSKSTKVNIKSYADLVAYIQRLNTAWMKSTERLSPQVLLDLLVYAEDKLYEFFTTLEPEWDAIFPVQWAGDDRSPNWFDMAREYTEKWHHQMQIRMALEKPLLMDTKYTEPLYDTFMLGLPYLYRDMTNYPTYEILEIIITGKLNKSYYLIKQVDKWVLAIDLDKKADTVVTFSEDEAWKIFTNTDREKEKYKSKLEITGDQNLGIKLLEYVTVLS
jgi:hypothetical protein